MKSVIGKCGTLIEYYTCYKSLENSTLRLHCSLSFPYVFLNCNHTHPNVWSLNKCDMFKRYTSLNEDLIGKKINREEKHPGQILEVTANYLSFLPFHFCRKGSWVREGQSIGCAMWNCSSQEVENVKYQKFHTVHPRSWKDEGGPRPCPDVIFA